MVKHDKLSSAVILDELRSWKAFDPWIYVPFVKGTSIKKGIKKKYL